jgi:hypothetical protein
LEALFCIAAALVGAHEGDDKNGLIMAGRNAYRIHEIVPVRQLVDELVAEASAALAMGCRADEPACDCQDSAR